MTVSRNSIFAVLALVAAIFFLFHGATVKATDQGATQYTQRLEAQVMSASPVESLEAPITQVVVTGQRMSEAEKAAFDRDPS